MDAEAVAQAVLETVARRPEVMAAYLFGSFATGHAHALSDVDVAVLFATGASDDAIWEGTLDLNGELRAAVHRDVDVVALNRAPLRMAFQVLKHGRLLLDRDADARSLWVMNTLSRYYDAKYYYDYQDAQLIKRIREGGLGRGYERDGATPDDARRASARLKAMASATSRRLSGG